MSQVLILVAGGEAPSAATARLLQTVRDFKSHAPAVRVTVARVRPKDAANARIKGALKARGVADLPALLVRGQAFVGYANIDAYLRSIAMSLSPTGDAAAGESGETAADATASAQLDEYMQAQMMAGAPDSEMGFGPA